MTEENNSTEQTRRTVISLWSGFLIISSMLLVVLLWFRPELFRFDPSRPLLGGDETFKVTAYAVIAVILFAASIILKRMFFLKAEREGDAAPAISGILVASALCEAISVFGFILGFFYEYQYFFLWFALGIIGLVLHIPKRDQLHLAMYRKNEGARTSRPH